ncbi:hypothetical protein SASPL_147725 [Salvia splendens]|uniref:RING-type E3 ubiquitin transferase n=1 Tax=Salvia splendens TaxID=180675 RepID=A0A8X8WFR3_SALSN|nr:probable E3 ubiquitin-protein ligase RHC2A [Salvia splendens]KAG6393483.1 hypothetical protein SASPL_147725 [Salvia splendens]
MSSTYWCHRCNRFLRAWNPESIDCPDCSSGFVEEVEAPPPPSSISDSRQRRFPAAAMYMMQAPEPCPIPGPASVSSPRLRRSRRNGGDRSPFNPVILLRGGASDGGGGGGAGAGGGGGGFELYYDDRAGSGLRPLPATMSEFLLGSGFDRLLDQLSQIEANGMGRIDSNPPASKAAIESMPTVSIIDRHIAIESHCAVCKEAFELGSDAREMPCSHLYHQDCILPWLSLRNSCPVCRHELAAEDNENGNGGADANRGGGNEVGGEDETVGMTIWRLPGGGFAVGRFSGGGRGELPVVYTEMDGRFNNNGVPRRVSWSSRGSVSRNRGGLRRLLTGFMSCFGRSGSSTSTPRISRWSGSLSSVFSSPHIRRARAADEAFQRIGED